MDFYYHHWITLNEAASISITTFQMFQIVK